MEPCKRTTQNDVCRYSSQTLKAKGIVIPILSPVAVNKQFFLFSLGLVPVLAEKCSRLIQQVTVSVKFMPQYFCRAGIQAQTAIRAAVVYGRARIQRDGILRAYRQTPLAIAFSEPHPLAKSGDPGITQILWASFKTTFNRNPAAIFSYPI
jgi:hypothetical protein